MYWSDFLESVCTKMPNSPGTPAFWSAASSVIRPAVQSLIPATASSSDRIGSRPSLFARASSMNEAKRSLHLPWRWTLPANSWSASSTIAPHLLLRAVSQLEESRHWPADRPESRHLSATCRSRCERGRLAAGRQYQRFSCRCRTFGLDPRPTCLERPSRAARLPDTTAKALVFISG